MSLEEMQEEIERLYINMENELLLNIANKLSQGKPMEIDKWDLEKNGPIIGSGGVNEWQLERLKELGGLNEENAKIIAKYSGKTQEEVEKVFERAREIGTEVDDKILSLGIKAGILNEINPVIEDIAVKNILHKAMSTVLTTFNSQNNSLLASAGDNYRKIVNDVSSQVLAGTKTTAKAMQEAVSKLAENGLTGFTARNGAEWSPEAYTKMVTRANTRNTINQIQEERMKLAGNDYVEISSHLGARPLCSEDQGKVFSLSGNTTPIEDGLGNHITVYNWNNSSYGEPAGILGINCGHSRHAFVPGISILREKDFTKEENDKAYQEKQQQRLYERTIRNKKREIEMLKTTNAEENYIRQKRNQLSDYRKQYLEFLDKTGRTRISANEWINETTFTNKINKNNTKVIQNYKQLSKKQIEEFQKSSNKCYNKLTSDEKDAMYNYSMDGYQDVNDYLNGKYEGFNGINDMIADIDNSMDKYDLKDNVLAYRGTDAKYYKKYNIGDVFKEKMYYSTSLNKNIAQTFADDKENPMIVEIRVPKETKCIYIGDNTKYEFEAELLLYRNLKYKIIDKSDSKLILEVVNEKRK